MRLQIKIDFDLFSLQCLLFQTKIDRNTVLAENIEGHRGEADIDTLMKYIESDSMDAKVNKSPRTGQSNGARSGCKVRAKEDEPRQGKRRSRDSTGKLHKCNRCDLVFYIYM